MILLCVRWYLRYPLSYRNLEEMMHEWVLKVNHSTIYRWVQRYSPELDERCRPHLCQSNDSWRVDETIVKVKGQKRYLYKAVNSAGKTLDFLLTAKQNSVAAKRFLRKLLQQDYVSKPRVINTDKHPAYPKAIRELKASGELSDECEHRPVKYLNNVIEQDQRKTKHRVRASQNFRSFWSAQRTLRGYEIIHAISKGQLEGVSQRDTCAQVEFIHQIFEIAV
ncbi:MAG: IS6 family transposase [Cyanobacteria bacterium J06642_11]